MIPIPSCSGWGRDTYVGTPPDVAMADMSDGGYVRHTCGLAASDGHVECWGEDNCNRVSDAPTTGAYSFTSVGRFSSCAIVHTTATALCWGCVSCNDNDKGQCNVRCCHGMFQVAGLASQTSVCVCRRVGGRTCASAFEFHHYCIGNVRAVSIGNQSNLFLE